MRAILLSGILLGAAMSNGLAAESLLPRGVMKQDGRPAPALRLKDMDGKLFDLAEARGRWVFVHFWASWCGPCRREMPTIQRLIATRGNLPLEVVLVNTAETEDAVFSFLGIAGPDLSTLLDPDGLVTEAWQPRGLPATFLVDPEGRIQYLALGGRKWDSQPYIEFLHRITQPTS